jgi:hypothetical protein
MMRVSWFMTTRLAPREATKAEASISRGRHPGPVLPSGPSAKDPISIQHVPKRQLVLQYQFLGRYAYHQSCPFQVSNDSADSLDCEAEMIGDVLM